MEHSSGVHAACVFAGNSGWGKGPFGVVFAPPRAGGNASETEEAARYFPSSYTAGFSRYERIVQRRSLPMRYFFNVYMDGQEIADLEGGEFEDFDAAHSEAARIAGELLRDFSVEIDRNSELEILDEDGATVLNLPVHGNQTLH